MVKEDADGLQWYDEHPMGSEPGYFEIISSFTFGKQDLGRAKSLKMCCDLFP